MSGFTHMTFDTPKGPGLLVLPDELSASETVATLMDLAIVGGAAQPARRALILRPRAIDGEATEHA